jgi:hypothetical protein
MDDATLQKLLRDQLPTLAEPTTPPAGAAQRVRDAVTGRRRRRRAALGAGAGGAAFAILAPLAIVLGSGGDDPTDPATDGVGEWHQIADSPLSPRAGSASIWTGREMIVAGGDVAPPCPPTADCVGPKPDELRADGAAYNPDDDTWRSIAPAPVPFTNPTTTWSGREMIVLTERHTLAYNPTTDAWRELDPPPGGGYLIGGEWDGRDLIFWQSEERAGTNDWSLDPSTGQWTRVPPDPFGATFDRAYVWIGDRYVFLALPMDGGDAKTFQVAEYDPATREWQRRPASHIGFGGVDWFFHQGYVVNPYEDPRLDEEQPTGGAYDPATGMWVATPRSGHYLYDGCRIGPLGSLGDWLAPGGGVLYSLDPSDTVVAPDCPQLPEPTAAAWSSQEVIIWGGPDREHEANTALGLTWTPPPAGD